VSFNTATTPTNTHGTHPSGDTIQDGPCTGLDHVEIITSKSFMRLSLNSNGGKTHGTPGECPSPDTTVLMELSNTATTTTNTLGIQQLGDTTQDGL